MKASSFERNAAGNQQLLFRLEEAAPPPKNFFRSWNIVASPLRNKLKQNIKSISQKKKDDLKYYVKVRFCALLSYGAKSKMRAIGRK